MVIFLLFFSSLQRLLKICSLSTVASVMHCPRLWLHHWRALEINITRMSFSAYQLLKRRGWVSTSVPFKKNQINKVLFVLNRCTWLHFQIDRKLTVGNCNGYYILEKNCTFNWKLLKFHRSVGTEAFNDGIVHSSLHWMVCAVAGNKCVASFRRNIISWPFRGACWSPIYRIHRRNMVKTQSYLIIHDFRFSIKNK